MHTSKLRRCESRQHRTSSHVCLCSSAGSRWETSDSGKPRVPARTSRRFGRTPLALTLRVQRIAGCSACWSGVGWKSSEVCEVFRISFPSIRCVCICVFCFSMLRCAIASRDLLCISLRNRLIYNKPRNIFPPTSTSGCVHMSICWLRNIC